MNALRAFDAAAREESFSRAAEALHVSHTAISHQVRKLEERLGQSLFRRDGRNVRLTRTGASLHARTRDIFDEVERLEALYRRSAEPDELTVGCIPSLATRWLVPNLADFTERHPGARPRVLYAGADESFDDDRHDVLISLGGQAGADLVETPILSRRTQAVCSPGFLQRWGPFPRAEDLLAVPLLHDESTDGWRAWFAAAGVSPGRESDGPVYQDFHLLVVAAIAGHGAALCPVEAFPVEIGRGDLIAVSSIETRQDRYYAVYTRAQTRPCVSRFVSWFNGIVGKDEAAD